MENVNSKITYHQEGDYLIPNLTVPNDENENYQIGKYGHLRLSYLKNHKKGEYELLKISCVLIKHLIEVDIQAKEKVKLLIGQFKEWENISEDLKDTNPLEWVGKMNNIKNRAEEIVLKELIYVLFLGGFVMCNLCEVFVDIFFSILVLYFVLVV